MKSSPFVPQLTIVLCAVILVSAAGARAQNIFFKISTANTLNPAAVTINPPSGYSYSGAAPVPGTKWNVVGKHTTLPRNTTVGSTVTYSANNQAASGVVKDAAGNTLSGVTLAVTYYSAVTTGTRDEPSTASGENTIQSGGVMQSAFRNYYNGSGNYFTYTLSGLPASKPFDLYLYGGTTGSGQGVGAALAAGNVLGVNPSTATTPNTTAPLGGIWGGASPNYTLVNSNATWAVLHGQSDSSGNFAFKFNGGGSAAYLNGFQLVALSAAPVITGLANQTIITGENAALSATITGFPAPELKWLENGITIPDQTSATLTLASVQPGQNGYVYSLVANNSEGVVTQSMTLTVTNQFTLNLDVNISSANNYTGTAIAPDTGTYWNAFNVPAATSSTLSNVRYSSGLACPIDVTFTRTSGGDFSAWNNAGANGNPNPLTLMQDYLFTGPYTVTISDLPPGHYALYAYAHGDNTGQASTVTLNAANGGASGSTTDVGNYRDIYQSGARGNSYLNLNGTVGGARTLSFTTAYLNGFQLQLVANNAPVAANDSAGTTVNTPLQIAVDKLASKALDADNDTVTVTGVSATSTNGGTVALNGGVITYTPVASFVGADRFTYTVSDTYGATNTATVYVAVAGNSGSGPNLVGITSLGGGSAEIKLLGIPGQQYALQWSTNMTSPNWVSVVTNTAAANGWLLFTNNSSASENYFRTRHVP